MEGGATRGRNSKGQLDHIRRLGIFSHREFKFNTSPGYSMAFVVGINCYFAFTADLYAIKDSRELLRYCVAWTARNL